MLTLEILVHNLRKTLRDNYQSVGDNMIAGGAKSMEQYKYMLGQAHAYQSIDQALTEMLNKQNEPEEAEEEKEDERQADNVVDFPGSTED